MEIIQKKLRNTSGDRVPRTCILLFLFLFAIVRFSVAQTADSASATVTDSASSSDGFAKKENTAKLFEEAREIAAKGRRNEILQYVVMVAGFLVVIGIAWFTTVLARKRKIKEDEVRAIRMQRIQHTKHKPHPRR